MLPDRLMYDLEFPQGLPAFETYTRFRLVQSSRYEQLLFLESKENPDLSFPVVPVPLLDPNYQLTLSDEDCIALGIEAAGTALAQIVCLAVVTAYEDLPPTANLLAPVVVNFANGRAVQSVRADAVYSHKHPLIPPEVACS
jgi:flagellar assembly factor FliW